MQCHNCSHECSAEQAFCSACGVRLDAAAPPGLSRLTDPGNYTPPHLVERILTARSAVEGERKQVTVLFCDIANSTPLAERLGAERMHAVLNTFFELVLAQVHRYDGTVNQFLGDGLMALFGAPLTLEDHARRAVLAAIAIRDEITAHSAGFVGEPAGLQIRMGINTGTVVVGKIGDNLRMDYTAIGDTTNVAARLQGVAVPGTILIAEEVRRHVARHVELQFVGTRLLKGKSKPIALYQVGKAMRPGARLRDMPMAEATDVLVGRDVEVNFIKQALQQLAAGRGSILTISGEAGLGKSRLVEAARDLAHRLPVRWAEGSSVSFGKKLSYWPIRQLLRDCFELNDNINEAQSLQRLQSGLQCLFGADTADVFPFVATLLSLPVSGAQA
nr:adenylate/guanylate cyclase domain-containing protein [Noviherbaspirillum malthae]